MAMGGKRQANQSAIWDDIALKSERLEARSATQAMKAMYDARVGSTTPTCALLSGPNGKRALFRGRPGS